MYFKLLLIQKKIAQSRAHGGIFVDVKHAVTLFLVVHYVSYEAISLLTVRISSKICSIIEFSCKL